MRKGNRNSSFLNQAVGQAREGITEALKAEDQMEWVRRMNALRSAAEEVVPKALIYC